MGRETEQTLPPQKHIVNKYVKKMLNITNHLGNANQNHNEISSHTFQDVCYQKDEINAGEDVVKGM